MKDDDGAIARMLVDLLIKDPQLYALVKGTMQDPRQNHVIREEEEITDL